MALQNPWVVYITRSFQQIKADILAKLPTNTPEITDHTEGNILIKMLSVWSGLHEMLGYYVDNAARESHLVTARLFTSGAKIAKLMDYRVRGRIPSTANLTFISSIPAPSDITIPVGTEVETSDGVKWFTDTVAVILTATTEITVGATQKVEVLAVSLGVSDGTGKQTFVLGDDIVDSSIVGRVNALGWTPVDSFSFSLFGDEHFVGRLNEDRSMTIEFGDDINGKIPPVGEAIDVDYFTTEGADGNTGVDTIDNLISAVTVPTGVELTVTNRVRSSGGVDNESLISLQRRVPLSVRTLFRAVTRQDYADVTVLAAGVAQAAVEFDCGKKIDLFIAPEGGGIASLSLIATTQIFIDERKMITTFVNTQSAGEVRINIEADVIVIPSFANAVVETAVKANLVTFLSIDNQKIFGQVKLGDIYEVIETTDGVQSSEVIVMKTIPFARPIGHVTTILWDRETLETSTTTVKWNIKIISATTYQLFKDDSFLANVLIGATVSEPEIEFTVNPGVYTIGEEWEFFTYKFFGSVELAEPSLPVGLTADFIINTTGGI